MKKFLSANGAGYVVLCLLFLLRASIPTNAQTPGPSDVNEMLNKRMDLTVSNKSLKTIFKLISSTTGLRFVASTSQLDVTDHYSINVKDFSVTQILIELLGRQGFTWTVRGDLVIFSRSGPLLPFPPNSIAKMNGKMNVITGIVMDVKGEVLPGATVRVSGTNLGATTDETGRFSFMTELEDLVLYTTYTGYVPVETVVNGDSIRIKLAMANNILDETVVMAYGLTTRRTNTGSIGKVSSAEISRQPVANILGALEGRIPGLAVTPSSGVNGTSFSVQIRGRNSFANGSDPLYIIDGVPYISSKTINLLGSIAVQNFDAGGISPFNNLNKEDVESIEILKDADATAIYGSRGANGVVLITTKRGKEGKASLQIKVNKGVGKVPGLGNLLSKEEYMAMRKEAFANDGLMVDKREGSAGYAPDLLIWDQNRNRDWQKDIIGGTANIINLNLALNGGSKVFQYRLSGSLLKSTSVFPDGMDMPYLRGTGDASVTYLSKNKKLSFDLSGKYGKDRNQMFDGTLLGTMAPPNAPGPKDDNGKLVWAENGAEYSNPIADLYRKYTIKTANLLGSMKLGYRIVDSLSFLLSAGINRYRDSENSQFPIIARNPDSDSASFGAATFGTQEIRSYIVEPQVDYTNTFKFGKINALIGTTWQYSSNKNMVLDGRGYTDDSKLDDLSAAATTSITGKYSSKYKYAALFGRVIYNYKDRYIVNFSARRDGSSRFGPGKRWSNFGSVGGAWLFSNERFVQNSLEFLDYGKLRGSYGISGNDQIGDYRYLDTWTSNNFPNTYQNNLPMIPEALFNPNFSWERSKKIETALELGFWDNKLITTLAYFNSTNDKQIIPFRLPSQTGFMNVIKNEGVVIKNTGWEFDMSAEILKRYHFSWRMNANITFPKNKLVAFPDLDNYTIALYYSVGYPLNVLKLYHNTGVDKTDGLYKFEDVNKDGILSYPDYRNVGNLDPKFYGGIGNTFQYKGLRLEVFLTLRKQTIPNYFYAAFFNLMSPGTLANQSRWVLDRWQHSGDDTKVQRYVTNNVVNGQSQSYQIWYSDAVYENNFFLKVKNVSLSYSLSPKLLKGRKLSGLKGYIQGQNLFTLTNYKGLDPETPYYFSLPTLRIVTVGLELVL